MPQAETITVTMTPDTLRALRESVQAGAYASIGEALEDAVRAWQSRRREHAAQLDGIRTRIRRSLDDPRPDLTSDEVQEQLEALFVQAELEAPRA